MSLFNHGWFQGCALKISKESQCCCCLYLQSQGAFPAVVCCLGRQSSPCSPGCPSTDRAAPLPAKGLSPPPLEQARNSRAREISPQGGWHHSHAGARRYWGRAVRLLPVALGALAAQHSSYSWLGALKRLHWSFPGSHGAARPGQGHWGHTGGPDVLVASVGLPLSLCRHCSLLGLKCFSVWFNQSQVQLRGSSPRPCPCPAAFPFGNVMAPPPSRAASLLLSRVCPCPCRDGAGAGPAAPGEDLGVPE